MVCLNDRKRQIRLCTFYRVCKFGWRCVLRQPFAQRLVVSSHRHFRSHQPDLLASFLSTCSMCWCWVCCGAPWVPPSEASCCWHGRNDATLWISLFNMCVSAGVAAISVVLLQVLLRRRLSITRLGRLIEVVTCCTRLMNALMHHLLWTAC